MVDVKYLFLITGVGRENWLKELEHEMGPYLSNKLHVFICTEVHNNTVLAQISIVFKQHARVFVKTAFI